DDRTRFAIARALGSDLKEREEFVRQIEERFRAFGKVMGPANRVQARIPIGAEGIRNPGGTAPGITCTLHGAKLFAVPGVPREMKEMFAANIKPDAVEHAGGSIMKMRRIHLFGIGESTVGSLIEEFMKEGANPEVGTTVNHGTITVRLLASGKDQAETDRLINETESEIVKRLGHHVFGYDNDSLANSVISLLKEKKQKVSLAESCTGGMIAEMIVGISGASDVLSEGIVCYSNEAKIKRLGVGRNIIEEHGAVSEEVVRAMAEGERNASGSDFSVAVTGVAGPTGGSEEKPVGTAWIAVSGPYGTVAHKNKFLSDRQGNRMRAANMALAMLRAAVAGHPMPWVEKR
ncbi:MAG: CinA family nicotinamide mononucleotide deamidase-related protein, partial [Planctomycetes bacterium]|nr:CinA family nicotinamide mononucleotide deamidase-related protein [Planctomycetota bacterium]